MIMKWSNENDGIMKMIMTNHNEIMKCEYDNGESQ